MVEQRTQLHITRLYYMGRLKDIDKKILKIYTII